MGDRLCAASCCSLLYSRSNAIQIGGFLMGFSVLDICIASCKYPIHLAELDTYRLLIETYWIKLDWIG
jgi:hypothetical protein